MKLTEAQTLLVVFQAARSQAEPWSHFVEYYDPRRNGLHLLASAEQDLLLVRIRQTEFPDTDDSRSRAPGVWERPAVVAMRYDPQRRAAELFVDGRPAATAELNFGPATEAHVLLGASRGEGAKVAKHFCGLIAEVMLFDDSLADEELAMLDTHLSTQYDLNRNL